MNDTPPDRNGTNPDHVAKRAGFSLVGAIVMFGFVWIVFDELALALIAAVIAGAIGAGAPSRGRGADHSSDGAEGGGD